MTGPLASRKGMLRDADSALGVLSVDQGSMRHVMGRMPGLSERYSLVALRHKTLFQAYELFVLVQTTVAFAGPQILAIPDTVTGDRFKPASVGTKASSYEENRPILKKR
jgi:hypothetical protein